MEKKLVLQVSNFPIGENRGYLSIRNPYALLNPSESLSVDASTYRKETENSLRSIQNQTVRQLQSYRKQRIEDFDPLPFSDNWVADWLGFVAPCICGGILATIGTLGLISDLQTFSETKNLFEYYMQQGYLALDVGIPAAGFLILGIPIGRYFLKKHRHNKQMKNLGKNIMVLENLSPSDFSVSVDDELEDLHQAITLGSPLKYKHATNEESLQTMKGLLQELGRSLPSNVYSVYNQKIMADKLID